MAVSLSIHPDLRIITFEDHALAYLLGASKKVQISFAIVEYLLGFSKTQAGYAAAQAPSPPLLSKLIDNGFVVTDGPANGGSTRTSHLNGYNWKSAADYLNITHNYPFFEYDKDGGIRDNNRMHDYLSVEQETERFKDYAAHPVSFQGVSPQRSAEHISMGATGNDLENILCAVSLGLGVLTEAPLRTGGTVFKKTVPSGGGRHPIEAYLIDLASQTVHHFNAAAHRFHLVQSAGNTDLYTSLFGVRNTYVNFDVKFAIIFTCVWERNMFRYREPRTFRSVHLDAGHASMQIETALFKMNYPNQVQYNVYAINIERLLGLDPLEEGVMSAIMIGNRHDAA